MTDRDSIRIVPWRSRRRRIFHGIELFAFVLLVVAASTFLIVRAAGATGIGFISGQGCEGEDGISLTWNVSNPTDSVFAVDESTPALPATIPPHGSVSVTEHYPSSAVGSTIWADISGRFVDHPGDAFYGTPGVVEDLPWSDGASVVLEPQHCTTPPPPVSAPVPTTVPPTTAPVQIGTGTSVTVPETPTSAFVGPDAPPDTAVDVAVDTTPVSKTPLLPVRCCPAGTTGSGGQLAFTGAEDAGLAALGVVLVVVGAGLLVLRYRYVNRRGR